MADSDFLAGEIHALVAFAVVVTATHPQREAFSSHLVGCFQVALAKLESTMVPEKVIQGFQYATDEVLAASRLPMGS